MPGAERRSLADAVDRAGAVLRRGWYWAADYRWVTWAMGRGYLRSTVPPGYRDGHLSPVLVLPGVLEDWTMMRPVTDRLSAAGHPVHVLHELGRNTVGVADGAALATAYLAVHDLRDVVLVAHSKGGLIGKQVLLDDDEARVRRLVTIATPFAGSELARLIPSQMVRSLGPTDALIVELQRRAEVNHLITSICPSFDPHIPGGSRLEGATNIRVPAMGHFRVLADPRVLAEVVRAAR